MRQHVLHRHDTERDLLRRWEQLAKANAALRTKNRKLRRLADDAIATVDSMNAAIQEL